MKTQDAVAGRALALGLIALRAQYENGFTRGKDDVTRRRARQRGQELLDWASDQKIEAFLSRAECELHRKSFGSWSHSDAYERSWRIESLKAVLWCIHVFDERPDYFSVGELEDTYNRLPVGNDVTPFLAAARLRGKAEIEHERDLSEFLNWRCRTELLRLDGVTPPFGDSYEQVVARALRAVDESGLPVEHDGVDVIVNGVWFANLGEEKGDVISICYERHLALEWVMGEDDWDETRAHT